MLSCGLDIGSLYTKAVVLRDGVTCGSAASLTGGDTRQAAERVLREALAAAGEEAGSGSRPLGADPGPRAAATAILAVTGAGKNELGLSAERVTEVLCAARGARLLSRAVRCVIDLGAENARVVRLDERGDVAEFSLNERCAAGSGVFLDAMAKVMGVPVERLGPLSLESTADVNITSMCVAFAESEVVSLVHRQTPRQDILRGLHRSIATRVFGMARRVETGGETMLIGWLARNVGIVRALEELMKKKLVVPEDPHMVSALGAAAIAAGMRGDS
jgi:predicted CoA-substrate-specific enzyme activase